MIDIINPSVEHVVENDPLKKIELCGRVCYKSESKITEDSATRMIKALIKNGHTSVLEHYFIGVKFQDFDAMLHLFDRGEFDGGFFLKFLSEEAERNVVYGNVRAWRNYFINYGEFLFVSRLLTMFKRLYGVLFDDIKGQEEERNFNVDNFPFSVFHYDKYATFRIITSRGITHELVRHRTFSFSQESTRYCNYGGKPIKFIRPLGFEWANNETSEKFKIWRSACSRSAIDYEKMLECGMKPQEARDVLNNSTKTEIMMTGTYRNWKHFLGLRTDEKTVHPEMLVIAKKIQNLLNNIEDFNEN